MGSVVAAIRRGFVLIIVVAATRSSLAQTTAFRAPFPPGVFGSNRTATPGDPIPVECVAATVGNPIFREAVAGGTAGTGAARLTEIGVELAWIADPVLCAFYPSAHAKGATLEIGGYVPDAAARDRALEIAVRHCALTVVDRLKVVPARSDRRPSVPADHLQRAAAADLQQEFAANMQQAQIRCTPAGQLTVTGLVRSHEQRLRISQRLRRMPGCVCVVNLLQVKGDDGSAPHIPDGDPPSPVARILWEEAARPAVVRIVWEEAARPAVVSILWEEAARP
jgi:hypothetical protein